MTSVSEEAGRSLTAQHKSLAVVTDRQKLHSYPGSGRCKRRRDTRETKFSRMHRAKDTEDGGKERVLCSASVEVFTWCFHVCLPDCILGQRRHCACPHAHCNDLKQRLHKQQGIFGLSSISKI
ncbi:hypothetical protein INR49_012591 [Xyrichtys novacula]|uniref:Uncharacterized protein n=1 Tax=Xyrichtys novacula TaxID=13765 RepID=A0AAV1ERT5_XYRNO|nr:hypothetical protein INR49_012591 [Xyrichtys novacula]